MKPKAEAMLAKPAAPCPPPAAGGGGSLDYFASSGFAVSEKVAVPDSGVVSGWVQAVKAASSNRIGRVRMAGSP